MSSTTKKVTIATCIVVGVAAAAGFGYWAWKRANGDDAGTLTETVAEVVNEAADSVADVVRDAQS